LFLSRAGLHRLTPRATPILLLAALAPDIDIVALAGGPLSYLHYHRHLTHSLLLAPVLALAVVVLARAAGPVRWAGAFIAALIGVASHLLLDLTNIFGVRLLLPFSARWFHLDLTSIVDPWIWAMLLAAVAGPFLSRLVGSEIASGGVRDPHAGRGFARAALAFLLLYNCGRAVLHARAAAMLDARVYQGAQPLRVAALPSAANPLRWRGVVETESFYAVSSVDVTREFDPGRATVFYKPEPGPAIEAAGGAPGIREFLGFSRYPLWRVSPASSPDGASLVELVDLRFGTPLQPGIMVSALVSPSGAVLRTHFGWGTVRLR
jgi:inner membrane protein